MDPSIYHTINCFDCHTFICFSNLDYDSSHRRRKRRVGTHWSFLCFAFSLYSISICESSGHARPIFNNGLLISSSFPLPQNGEKRKYSSTRYYRSAFILLANRNRISSILNQLTRQSNKYVEPCEKSRPLGNAFAFSAYDKDRWQSSSGQWQGCIGRRNIRCK